MSDFMENDSTKIVEPIGKVRKTVDWVFFAIGIIMILGTLFLENGGPIKFVSLILFIIFTLMVMPRDPFLSICQNVLGKPWKLLRMIILIVVFFVAGGLLPSSETTNSSEEQVAEQITSDSTEDSDSDNATNTDDTTSDTKSSKIEELLGSDGYSNFEEAASEIGLSMSDVKGFEQIDDWASGKRYSFTYSGQQVLLYMLESNYVDGINTGGYEVYKDGLEPLNINDFIVDSGIQAQLQVDSENAVKGVLNHPDTANFDWWTTGTCNRAGQYYILSANVKAKNSFGVQDTITFTTEYKVTDDTYSRIYFECDGAVVSGTYVEPTANRSETDSKLASDVSEGGFVLTDGQLGDYGQMQDNDIILYYVPSGTYKVTCLNKGKAFVSLPHDDENCDVYTFDAAGDVQTITIPDGNVVQLMINTSLQFDPQ